MKPFRTKHTTTDLKRILFVLTITAVLPLDTCLAQKASVTTVQPKIQSTLPQSFDETHMSYQLMVISYKSPGQEGFVKSLSAAKNLILKQRPALFQEIEAFEKEFSDILKKVKNNLQTYLHAKYGFHQKKSTHAFNSLRVEELVILGLPRKLAMGKVSRDAINFKNLNLILFNSEHWKTLTTQQKTRLAIVEALGLLGFESEEDRYRETAFITKALSRVGDQGESYSRNSVFIYKFEKQELERFSGNHFFLNESYPQQDYTGYLMINPENPLFNPQYCRKDSTPQNYDPDSMFHRMLQGVTLADPMMLKICENFINANREVPLRLIYSKDTRLVQYCKPEFP